MFFFFLFSALDMISLKISDVFIQYGQSNIEISCVVNCSNQINVIGIQLIRSNEPILSLRSKNEIRWHDLELENRSEATGKGSCSDGDLSYLRVEIPSFRIKPLKDAGLYVCRLRGYRRDDTVFVENSEIIMLNITGNLIHILFTWTMFVYWSMHSKYRISISLKFLHCLVYARS